MQQQLQGGRPFNSVQDKRNGLKCGEIRVSRLVMLYYGLDYTLVFAKNNQRYKSGKCAVAGNKCFLLSFQSFPPPFQLATPHSLGHVHPEEGSCKLCDSDAYTKTYLIGNPTKERHVDKSGQLPCSEGLLNRHPIVAR